MTRRNRRFWLSALLLPVCTGLCVQASSAAPLYKLSFDNDGAAGTNALDPYQLATGDVSPEVLDRLTPSTGQIPMIVTSARPNSGRALGLVPPGAGNAGYLSRNTTGYFTIAAGGGFTLEAAFLLNAHSPAQIHGLINQFGAGGMGPSLRLTGGSTDNPHIVFGLNQTGASIDYTPVTPLVGAWHTVAVVYTRTFSSTQSKLQLYLDGVEVANTVYATSTQQILVRGGISFGVDSPTAATKRVLNGQLDNCAISPDILTPATFVFPPTPNGPSYGSVAPPAVGQHPRVCLTASELPELRTRVTSGLAKNGYDTCKAVLTNLGTDGSTIEVLVDKFEGSATVNDSERQQLADAIQSSALAALIDNSATGAAPAKRALLAFVHKVSPTASDLDYSRTLPNIGLGYDWLFNYLATSEQNEVRTWIAAACVPFAASLETAPWGFKPGAVRNSNWTTHTTGAFGIAILAIEGETGYQSIWYDKAKASITDYFNQGISDQGCPAESVHYFAYGTATGVYFMDGMARRGETVWNHSHLAKIPDYWTADLFPWGKDFNSLQDTKDIHVGQGDIYARMALQYRSSPMRWVYANWVQNSNQAYEFATSKALWAPEPDGSVQVTSLGRPLSTYFQNNGLAYLRTGWTSDDTYFETQSDPYLAGQSHGHSDRGSFTLASLGRLWAMDAGGWAGRDIYHNEVLIDGKGEGYYPHLGAVTAWQDGALASGLTMNNKKCYDWAAQAPGTAGTTLVDNIPSLAYNPVEKAFRTAILVKGNHPYALVSDNIKKDTTSRTYTWQMMTPLGNIVEPLDSRRLLLKPTDSGSYAKPITGMGQGTWNLSFTVPTTGNYNIWFLMGHDYWLGTGVRILTKIGAEAQMQFYAHSGDNSKAHWQKTYASKTLTGGTTYNMTVTTAGLMDLHAIAIAPDTYNAEIATAPVWPSGTTQLRFSNFTAPSGWQIAPADTNEPRLLLQVLNPSNATFSSDYFTFTRTSSPTESGRVLRLQANASSTEPKFWSILLPHRATEALPAVTTGATSATLTWPDGTVDNLSFGTTVSINRSINGNGAGSFSIAAQ